MKASNGKRKKKENTRTNRDLGKEKKRKTPELLSCHGARKWCGGSDDTCSSKRTI